MAKSNWIEMAQFRTEIEGVPVRVKFEACPDNPALTCFVMRWNNSELCCSDWYTLYSEVQSVLKLQCA